MGAHRDLLGGLRSRVIAGLAVAFAIASLASPSVVSAHAELDRAEPPIGGVVRSAPERLDAWFTQNLFRREGENWLEVTDVSGNRVDDGVTVVHDEDRTHMSVGLAPDLGAGEYTVRWQSLSADDGDTAEGSFTFTIDPTAPEPAPEGSTAPTSSPSVTAEPAPGIATDTDGGDDGATVPWWLIIAAAGIAAVGAAGVWALRLEAPRP